MKNLQEVKFPQVEAMACMGQVANLVRRLNDPDLNRYEREAMSQVISDLELRARLLAKMARDNEG